TPPTSTLLPYTTLFRSTSGLPGPLPAPGSRWVVGVHPTGGCGDQELPAIHQPRLLRATERSEPVDGAVDIDIDHHDPRGDAGRDTDVGLRVLTPPRRDLPGV